MQLEDHLGDILRKAGAAGNISPAEGAAAAGLAEKDFAALIETGRTAQKINFSALGKLLDLNPSKLKAIAEDWLPAGKILNTWRELRVFTTAGEGLTVNCYLIWDTATRDAALFDTGLDAKPIMDCLAENNLSLRHVFITHSHWDHVEALPQIRAAWPTAQLHSGSANAPAAQRNQAGEMIHIGGLRVAHRATPGHAEDGVTYIVNGWPGNAPAVAVVGDAIFAGSMGNGNGRWELAKEKIGSQILTLPAETLICPGHGPLTTVAEEVAHNPFF